MRSILGVMVVVLCAPLCRAGQSDAERLAAALEQAVSRAAAGDLVEAVRIISAESRTQKDPRELMEQGTKLQAEYAKLDGLGERDGIERISLRFSGRSFFRLRVADKRSEGVIVWTFVGYRFRDDWDCKGTRFNGSDDLMKLMNSELDPADAAPVVAPDAAGP